MSPIFINDTLLGSAGSKAGCRGPGPLHAR
jgi:hypothetical protein